MINSPLITIAVPSYNQGKYLDDALRSIFQQDVPMEVFVADGGSTDNSVDVIRRWEYMLAGWRSHKDEGQSSAINECIAKGSAPFVCWLNSDDIFLSAGLLKLFVALKANPRCPAVYGKVWTSNETLSRKREVWVEPFKERRLAIRCIISQPATLMRRSAWESVGGLDESLNMAMDYDLWWRLYKNFGSLIFVEEFIAINRQHPNTKTRNNRFQHYREAMEVVRRHNGRVPVKWWIAQPYAVWLKAFISRLF